jgi:hypothetical protein
MASVTNLMVEAGWITPAVGRSENNVQGHKLAGEETKLLATQRQLTYLVASASSLRRLYFVVLRLMYVMGYRRAERCKLVVSQASGKLPSSLSPLPRPTILALGFEPR